MHTKGIRYFGRSHPFDDDSQAEGARVALENIAKGAKTAALIEVPGGHLLVTQGADVELYEV